MCNVFKYDAVVGVMTLQSRISIQVECYWFRFYVSPPPQIKIKTYYSAGGVKESQYFLFEFLYLHTKAETYGPFAKTIFAWETNHFLDTKNQMSQKMIYQLVVRFCISHLVVFVFKIIESRSGCFEDSLYVGMEATLITGSIKLVVLAMVPVKIRSKSKDI